MISRNAWENSSTPKIVTPTYSNKLARHKSATKNTLFDFVTSPPLIACQTPSSKQDAANDFKARFYQHQSNRGKADNNNQSNDQNNIKRQAPQPLMATELKPVETKQIWVMSLRVIWKHLNRLHNRLYLVKQLKLFEIKNNCDCV